jgi:tripartite-type tricarboxylate transporter receptor subunit TctC
MTHVALLPRRKLLVGSLGAATGLAGAWPGLALGQEFPSRPITVIVPFAPGGPDRIARMIGEKLQASLKQAVVIDYKPGATGLIGTRFVQQAKPDGYTLLFTSNSSMVVAPLLRQPPSFDAMKDFVPLTGVMRYPMLLVVPPNSPAKTLADFVAMAKAQPGALNYSSNGVGSLGHLTLELFSRTVGISMGHIPFKGLGDVQTSVMSGEVQLATDGPLSIAELVRGGKVRALAVTGDKRVSAFPSVPSMKELGYPDVNVEVWIAFFGPKGMPEPVVRRLSEELGRIIRLDEIREQIVQGGLSEAIPGTPQDVGRLIERETPAFGRLIKQLGLKLD